MPRTVKVTGGVMGESRVVERIPVMMTVQMGLPIMGGSRDGATREGA